MAGPGGRGEHRAISVGQRLNGYVPYDPPDGRGEGLAADCPTIDDRYCAGRFRPRSDPPWV